MDNTLEMLIGGLLLFVVLAVLALIGLSNLTGLPFWDVALNARVLLLGPALFIGVWLLEQFEVPLPVRLENTWPVIMAAIWVGVHTLIAMKYEQPSKPRASDFSVYYDDDVSSLPWFAGDWCLWLVLIAIILGGYLIRHKRNSHY